MIGLASALPFSALAQYRAQALNESLAPCSRLEFAMGAGFLIVAAISATSFGTLAGGVGVALLAVTAWTDLRLRRVYLPVTVVAALELAMLGVFDRLPSDAVLGASALGLFSLLLWLLAARRGGWAGGDVFLFTLVGASFGFHVGLMLIAIAFVGGAAIYGALIAARLVRRDAPIPMIVLVYAAAPIYLILARVFAGSFSI